MPTYAYACKSCGHAFDAVQSFSDSALTECPECGGELRKRYGAVGVTFNGSGFYRTDSRASAGAGASSAASSSSSASS
ncbi:MAG TPA: FmdB family zinc ribbon protein [Microbacterium sp.]|nr:FmdB family zinc ribbon protein [Microbacterium sp.]